MNNDISNEAALCQSDKQAFDAVYDMLLAFPDLYRSASKFVTPKRVITLSRRRKLDKRSSTQEFVLTVGKPNFRGREFVKAFQKAGEPFPVKKVQVRRWGKATK